MELFSIRIQRTFQLVSTLFGENKHKITGKTLDIALDRLLQGSCFHLVEFCQMIIEHHSATSDFKNFVLDNL